MKVVELFAGVGGFRLGLEGWQGLSASSGYRKPLRSAYEVVWSNQWEPSTKRQHASEVYEWRWGKAGHSNMDVASVPLGEIPDHDVLVGGFPCQDYSVATTLKNSKGLLGKKGVLWWAIQRILSGKAMPPEYLILENVDRLLISPSGQRGRDFAVILQSLNELGYAVEWRVINAADYGMPQRRRRVFILAYQQRSVLYEQMRATPPKAWLLDEGTMAAAFPCGQNGLPFAQGFRLEGDLVQVSSQFNRDGAHGLFENTGLMVEGEVHTLKTFADYDGPRLCLGDILEAETSPSLYIDEVDLERWRYLKGPKRERRTHAEGYEYHYSEGGMAFPDALDKPSRTIITGEGGPSPSRFKHVVHTATGYRRLSPTELERLNMFPDGHTALAGLSDTKRAFFMGNALVVGVVEKIGLALAKMVAHGNAVQSR